MVFRLRKKLQRLRNFLKEYEEWLSVITIDELANLLV